MYARPLVDGVRLDFGVSGKLWRQALVLYDRQTRSLWSQRTHRAIAGERVGQQLEVIDSEITDWRTWKALHPETTVLVKPSDSAARKLEILLVLSLFVLLAVAIPVRRGIL